MATFLSYSRLKIGDLMVILDKIDASRPKMTPFLTFSRLKIADLMVIFGEIHKKSSNFLKNPQKIFKFPQKSENFCKKSSNFIKNHQKIPKFPQKIIKKSTNVLKK